MRPWTRADAKRSTTSRRHVPTHQATGVTIRRHGGWGMIRWAVTCGVSPANGRLSSIFLRHSGPGFAAVANRPCACLTATIRKNHQGGAECRILLASQEEPGMFDFIRCFPWVLETYCYHGPDEVLASLEQIIAHADKARERLGPIGR